MVIKQISLKNYRNYENVKIDFNNKINIIIGDNAQGKTNILESVYFLSITKSYRASEDSMLITKGKDFSTISAKLKQDKISKKINVFFSKNKKEISLNNSIVKKLSDFIGIVKIIMMSPEDIDIIKGSPSIRRNFLNVELSKLSKEYISKYNEYNKLLKIRNDYLKLLMTNSIADYRYLDIITEKLIDRAVYIYIERFKLISELNKKINKIYYDITLNKSLTLKYNPNIEIISFDEETVRSAIKEKLIKYRQKEISVGMTLYGPHRDDFSFWLDENNIEFYGSQGQQKLSVIALKLSLVYVFYERFNEMPILLLDDIFSELDKKKKNKIIDYINNVGQVIITTNDISDIKKNKLSNVSIYKIKNKKIIEKVI